MVISKYNYLLLYPERIHVVDLIVHIDTAIEDVIDHVPSHTGEQLSKDPANHIVQPWDADKDV